MKIERGANMDIMQMQAISDWTTIGIIAGGFIGFILLGVALEYVAFYKSIGGLKFKRKG